MDRPLISLYTTADVRKMDSEAIASGTRGYVLMTRAAQTSLDVIRVNFPEARSLLVLCGAGNNAGDGYVLARLARRTGLEVVVCALAPVERLGGDAAKAWRDYAADAVEQDDPLTPYDSVDLSSFDVIVDALLGTGLSRDVKGTLHEVVCSVNDSPVDVVSLDVPSGLNSDSGLPQPVAIRATVTVTFIAPKVGLYTGLASGYCGHVVCDRLGLGEKFYERCVPAARLLSEQDARSCLPKRKAHAHKGQHGRVLIVGGDGGMSGAVVLAAAAALRSGAGTVTVACHTRNREIVAGHMAEVMCVGVSQPDDLEPLLDACDVVAVGPGMGRGAWGRHLLDCVLKSTKPVVVDADGLRLLAGSDVSHGTGPMVVTPHPGEAAALLGTNSVAIQADRLKAAQAIADTFNAIAILKGDRTVVSSTGSIPAICGLGNPGMATAGSGDVLTGIVAGIWAQQSDKISSAQSSAAAAVYVHAQAGDRAAIEGERGLIASDLLTELRHCVNFDL